MTRRERKSGVSIALHRAALLPLAALASCHVPRKIAIRRGTAAMGSEAKLQPRLRAVLYVCSNHRRWEILQSRNYCPCTSSTSAAGRVSKSSSGVRLALAPKASYVSRHENTGLRMASAYTDKTSQFESADEEREDIAGRSSREGLGCSSCSALEEDGSETEARLMVRRVFFLIRVRA